MYLVRVYVTLKHTINDPNGLTILDGLQRLDFHKVRRVRSGKYIEIILDEDTEFTASREISSMCKKLLANTIIEDYRFELEQITDES